MVRPRLPRPRTSSGERYDQYDFTAAHRTLPLGTWVVVTNTDERPLRPGVRQRPRPVRRRPCDRPVVRRGARARDGRARAPSPFASSCSGPSRRRSRAPFSSGKRLSRRRGARPAARCWPASRVRSRAAGAPWAGERGSRWPRSRARLAATRGLDFRRPVPDACARTRRRSPRRSTTSSQRTFPGGGSRADGGRLRGAWACVPSRPASSPRMQRLLTTQLAAFYDPRAQGTWPIATAASRAGGRDVGLRARQRR